MFKKILIIQDGSEATLFPLLSLTIGLHKQYPGVKIFWIGLPQTSELIKYNKRIERFLNISREFTVSTLQLVFDANLCINTSYTNRAKNFASNCSSEKIIGFDRNGATSTAAEFFHNVMSGKIQTRKTILQLYYDLANLKWSGEGFGLSYYPKTKQSDECGVFLRKKLEKHKNCSNINMPKPLLKKLDCINKYSTIITDDLFTAYSAISLRKQCTLYAKLPYKMEFFNRGNIETFEGSDKEIS